MRSADTSPEAHQRQMEIYRSMSTARRFEVAVELSETVTAAAADGIRTRHPEYSEQDVAWALHRLRLGDEIFQKAWPQAPIVTP